MLISHHYVYGKSIYYFYIIIWRFVIKPNKVMALGRGSQRVQNGTIVTLNKIQTQSYNIHQYMLKPGVYKIALGGHALLINLQNPKDEYTQLHQYIILSEVTLLIGQARGWQAGQILHASQRCKEACQTAS